jgi:hypothetical protein
MAFATLTLADRKRSDGQKTGRSKKEQQGGRAHDSNFLPKYQLVLRNS